MDISDSKFSTLFFTRNSDPVFHAALLFKKYGNVPTSVLEFLFFSQQPKNGAVYWLTFLDNYNQQYEYVENWLSELVNVNNESDWNYHRAKLRSKFILFKRVNTEKALAAFKDEAQVQKTIKNTGIIWNNCLTILEDVEYFPEKTPTKFELWSILLSIKNGIESPIIANEKHLEVFQQIIFQRSNQSFLKTYNLAIQQNSEDQKSVNYIEKSIETLIRKNNMEASLNKKTIGEKIKNIFKI